MHYYPIRFVDQSIKFNTDYAKFQIYFHPKSCHERSKRFDIKCGAEELSLYIKEDCLKDNRKGILLNESDDGSKTKEHMMMPYRIGIDMDFKTDETREQAVLDTKVDKFKTFYDGLLYELINDDCVELVQLSSSDMGKDGFDRNGDVRFIDDGTGKNSNKFALHVTLKIVSKYWAEKHKTYIPSNDITKNWVLDDMMNTIMMWVLTISTSY